MPTNARGTGWLTEAVAAEIRSRMGTLNMKQVDLSRATGIPKGTVSSMLGLKSAIDLEQLNAIAEALDVDADSLVGDAIRNWRTRLGDVYRPDGTLDPDHTTWAREPDEHVAELVDRKRRRSD